MITAAAVEPKISAAQKQPGRFVRELREAGPSDLGDVGGKAANLGELLRAGISVPDGYVVAVDTVGAGFHEKVIVVGGSSARMAEGNKDCPVDSAIIGVIDTIDFIPPQ